MESVTKEEHWQRCVRLAECHKAVDDYTIYLGAYDDEAVPWQYITGFKADTSTRINFVADHQCGLRFEWDVSFPDDVNASLPDEQKLLSIIAQLPASMDRSWFVKALDVCLGHLADQADIYHKAFRSYNDARTTLFAAQDTLK